MVKTLSWIQHSLKQNGLFATLGFVKNGLMLRYIRDIQKKDFMQKRVNGVKMFLDVKDPGVSRTLAIKGEREKDQVFVVRRELKPGMTVLDVGANIGSYALLEASLVGPNGKIYAIEPAPQNFALLQKNIALNQFENIIETHQVGASNQSGKGTFYVHAASNLHTFHPQKYREFAEVEDNYKETIDIDVVHISAFLEGKRPVDFIRMDIEGYEVEVIEGLLDTIRQGQHTPMILFEVHRPKYDDVHHNMRAQLKQLFDLGYHAKTLISSDETKALFTNKGYQPDQVIHTDGVHRGIYNGISNEDAERFICDIGFVRAALLAPK